MIGNIISYLNTRLSLTNLFEYSYPLCELIRQGEQVQPMYYCTNGEWKNVSDFDQFNGVSYFRKDGKVSQKIVDGNVSCDKFQTIELPLKLICVVPRSKMIDNSYTEDSIAAIINANLTGSSTLLKSQLGARKVTISVEDYETNGNTILSEEYEGVRLTDLRFEVSYVSLSVKVEVEINVNCIVLECADEDTCTRLLRSLSTDEKLGCILPNYDFTNQITYDNLTAQQVIDLTDHFSSGIVNIYKSDGTTLVVSVACGLFYNIPKHTIKNSALTILYNPEFDEDTILADKVFIDSDGTPSALVQGVNYTCTPQIQTVFLKGVFGVGIDTLPTLTIDADNAGTYTVEAQDGASGSLTYSINGGAFAAFVNPTVLAVADTIIAKRTVTTTVGYFKYSGTY